MSTSNPDGSVRRAGGRLLCAAAAIAAVTLLSSCGQSSPTQATSETTSLRTKAEAAATVAAKAHRDTVTEGVIVHRPLAGTGGDEINDDNPGNADVGSDPAARESNPCTLVTRAQAQAAIGRPIDAPEEAPLGPTCIYQPVGARTFVTLALETAPFPQIEDHIRDPHRSRVDDHNTYCGLYGGMTTFVPLERGKVLYVTGPCDVGRLLAGDAIPRLHIANRG